MQKKVCNCSQARLLPMNAARERRGSGPMAGPDSALWPGPYIMIHECGSKLDGACKQSCNRRASSSGRSATTTLRLLSDPPGPDQRAPQARGGRKARGRFSVIVCDLTGFVVGYCNPSVHIIETLCVFDGMFTGLQTSKGFGEVT